VLGIDRVMVEDSGVGLVEGGSGWLGVGKGIGWGLEGFDCGD
jgi:hypothetical protein